MTLPAAYPGPTADNLACLPDRMKELAQWVLWKGVWRSYPPLNGDRPTKIPCGARELTPIDITDQATWATFDYCVAALPAALEEWEQEGNPAYWGGGIGFALAPDGDLVGGDLDCCVDPVSGEIAPWAHEIVQEVQTYTELSPSTTGLRFLAQGTLPPRGRQKGHIQIYNDRRFLTLTGWRLEDAPATIEPCQIALNNLWCSMFAPQVGDTVWTVKENGDIQNVEPLTIATIAPAPSGELYARFVETASGHPLIRCERATVGADLSASALLHDAEIVQRVAGAKNAAKVLALVNGEWHKDYASPSEADLALCCHLAFWTRDPAQIDRLFRDSALMRDKWDDKRGAQTYGQRTIGEALARQNEYYAPLPTLVVSRNGSAPAYVWGSASAPSGGQLIFTALAALLGEGDDMCAWLVADLLPSGGFSLIAAKPKAGKSTLARNLALCIAQGKDFLGRKTQPGTVIYLALEEKRAEVRNHFRAMGATGEEPVYLHVAAAPVDGLAQVKRAMEQLQPALLIIDPLFRFVRVRDSNDYSQVSAGLEPILSLARESGSHVLCVHHTSKGYREGGDAILGSTAVFAAVDTAIIMRRTPEYRTIESQQRYGTDLDERILHYDKATGLVTLGETREGETLAHITQAMCHYLQAQSAPVTEGLIRADVEGSTSMLARVLRQLVEEGTVVRCGKGVKGEPFTYAFQGDGL